MPVCRHLETAGKPAGSPGVDVGRHSPDSAGWCGRWGPNSSIDVKMKSWFLVGNEGMRALNLPFKGIDRVQSHSLLSY